MVRLAGTENFKRLKSAIKREQNQTCLSYAEREQTRYEVSTLNTKSDMNEKELRTQDTESTTTTTADSSIWYS